MTHPSLDLCKRMDMLKICQDNAEFWYHRERIIDAVREDFTITSFTPDIDGIVCPTIERMMEELKLNAKTTADIFKPLYSWRNGADTLANCLAKALIKIKEQS